MQAACSGLVCFLNASAASLIASFVTAIATVVLGYVTWVLARETKVLSRATAQAHVVATIEPNDWGVTYVDLHVVNSGNAAAFDVELYFDPPLPGGARHRRDLPVPLQRISILRAGQELKSNLCGFADVSKKTFKVTISWKSEPRERKRTSISYDLSMRDYEGVSYLGARSPAVQLAEQMKKLREDWQNVAGGHRHIKADVYTQADRDAKAADLRAFYEEHIQKSAPGENG